jgi:hypothetical protein
MTRNVTKSPSEKVSTFKIRSPLNNKYLHETKNKTSENNKARKSRASCYVGQVTFERGTPCGRQVMLPERRSVPLPKVRGAGVCFGLPTSQALGIGPGAGSGHRRCVQHLLRTVKTLRRNASQLQSILRLCIAKHLLVIAKQFVCNCEGIPS